MYELKVATFNTFGGTLDIQDLNIRYLAITDYFLESNIDVIFFQEVFTYFHLSLLSGLVKKYQYCVYEKSLLGPKGGLVIFSYYPIRKSHYLTFSRRHIPYFPHSMVELLIQRGMLTAMISANEKVISLVNVHLTAVLNHDWSKKSSYYKELSSEISQLHCFLKSGVANNQVVIGGDFNIAKGTELYHRLIALPLLFDPFLNDFRPTQLKMSSKNSHKSKRIDYLFLYGRDNVACSVGLIGTKKVKKQNIYLSDHVGLKMLMLCSK